MADVEVGEQTSEILASIGVGAMLQFSYETDGISASTLGGLDQPVVGITGSSSETVFVTAYEWDEANSAKIQLQDQSQGFWSQGASGGGLDNPIVLGASTDETGFLLTDMGGGKLTIQMLVAPPPPFVLPRPSPGVAGWWLCSGFADPGSGRYGIQVVG